MKFRDRFSDKAKANAELYRQMNRKVIVNSVHIMYPGIEPANETLDKFQDQCEEYMFADNLPNNY